MKSGIYTSCPKGHLLGEDGFWCAKCNDDVDNAIDVALIHKDVQNLPFGKKIIADAKELGIPVYSLWHWIRGKKVILVEAPKKILMSIPAQNDLFEKKLKRLRQDRDLSKEVHKITQQKPPSLVEEDLAKKDQLGLKRSVYADNRPAESIIELEQSSKLLKSKRSMWSTIRGWFS